MGGKKKKNPEHRCRFLPNIDIQLFYCWVPIRRPERKPSVKKAIFDHWTKNAVVIGGNPSSFSTKKQGNYHSHLDKLA